MFAPIRIVYSLRPRAPIAILVAAAAVAMLFSSTPFLVPEIAARYRVSEGLAGGISVAQVGAFALASLLLPRLSAPTGRLLRASSLALMAANLLSALAGAFWMLIVLRLLAGAAAGSLTWIVWSDAMRQPRSLAGVASAGPVTALVSAPAFALLADLGDRAIFAVLAMAVLPDVFLRFEPEVTARRTSRVSRSRSNRVLLAALALLTFFGSSLFVFEAVAARETFGMSPQVASLAYSLNAAAGLMGARLAGRHRRPGWWLATAGPAAYLSIAGGWDWLYFLGMAWWGFAFWLGVPGVMQMLAERSLEPGERAGDAQAFMAAGRALGPVLGGGLTDAGAFVTLAGVAGLGITAAGVSVIGVQEGRDRLPPTDPRVVR